MTVDCEALARDLDALHAEIEAQRGLEDLTHLARLVRWKNACTALGYATACLGPNPLSMWLLGQSGTAGWPMLMHHIRHGAYDRIAEVPARYTARVFASRGRRLRDWLDWIDPEAWSYEHNIVHHYRLNEVSDSSLVEQNMDEADVSPPLRWAAVLFFAMTWRATYFAPSTFQVHRRNERRRRSEAPKKREHYHDAYNPLTPDGRAFWKSCVLPYASVRFVLTPALFALLGPWASFSVLVNLVGAELVTNAQTFFLIAGNHSGDDLYRFDTKAGGRGEFYARAILGTGNYHIVPGTGFLPDLIGFFHGWTNYHIEHHLFPDLTLRQYQMIQPRVRAVCEKHGLPYRQTSVLARARALIAIMIGKARLKRITQIVQPPRAAAAVAG